MDTGDLLREARARARLTQSRLADLASTSQATVSAYEHGDKTPTAATLARLLAAAGMRLSVVPASRTVVTPTKDELERRGRILTQVLDLAESLPARRRAQLRFPVLGTKVARGAP
jgi:transcriptional regulator with XRE-family HTH domain